MWALCLVVILKGFSFCYIRWNELKEQCARYWSNVTLREKKKRLTDYLNISLGTDTIECSLELSLLLHFSGFVCSALTLLSLPEPLCISVGHPQNPPPQSGNVALIIGPLSQMHVTIGRCSIMWNRFTLNTTKKTKQYIILLKNFCFSGSGKSLWNLILQAGYEGFCLNPNCKQQALGTVDVWVFFFPEVISA